MKKFLLAAILTVLAYSGSALAYSGKSTPGSDKITRGDGKISDTITGPIHIQGQIESTSGGFKLPDGTVVASAADLGGGGGGGFTHTVATFTVTSTFTLSGVLLWKDPVTLQYTTMTFTAPADGQARLMMITANASGYMQISWPTVVTDGARTGQNNDYTGINRYFGDVYLSTFPANTVIQTTTNGKLVAADIMERLALQGLNKADDSTVSVSTTLSTFNYGRPNFSGSASVATNVVYYDSFIPTNFSTNTVITVKLRDRLTNTDTGSRRYVVSMATAATGVDPNTLVYSNSINVDIAGSGSGVAGKQYISVTSNLTNWNTSWVADSVLYVRVARAGDDGSNDTSTQNTVLMEVYITYGVRQ